MSEKDESWIFQTEFEDLRLKIEEKYKTNNLAKHQYLSNLTLGQVVRIIKDKRLQKHFARLFNIKTFDFKLLSRANENRIFIRRRREKLRDINKINIIFGLVVTLRNRSFHFENILKKMKTLQG